MGLNVFFSRMSLSQSGFHVACSAPRSRRATRETDSFFSTLRACRAGHGARARARLATGWSPVDSPSAEPSGAEICLARPSRKRPAGRRKHYFTSLYMYSPHKDLEVCLNISRKVRNQSATQHSVLGRGKKGAHFGQITDSHFMT